MLASAKRARNKLRRVLISRNDVNMRGVPQPRKACSHAILTKNWYSSMSTSLTPVRSSGLDDLSFGMARLTRTQASRVTPGTPARPSRARFRMLGRLEWSRVRGAAPLIRRRRGIGNCLLFRINFLTPHEIQGQKIAPLDYLPTRHIRTLYFPSRIFGATRGRNGLDIYYAERFLGGYPTPGAGLFAWCSHSPHLLAFPARACLGESA
jgi:hypothetical protein